MIIFIQWHLPFDSKYANNIETFNECSIILMNYLLMCFSDFVPLAQTRHDIGFFYIGIGLGNIAVHIFIIIGALIIAFRGYLRRKGKCLPKKKQGKRATG